MSGDAVERRDREESFHDSWAQSAMENLPDPVHVNQAITSPELRYIHEALGEVTGKRVLDLGCGLGEASVYFGLQGAHVTAVDLSSEMLRATQVLADKHRVRITTHQAASESLVFKLGETFDIVYVGNLFHHVDIAPTLERILPHLSKEGILVSWDPLAYNPIINVYRAIATSVRTPDEHPLKIKDVRLIQSRFHNSTVRFFWFTSLAVFIVMAIFQMRNPNRIRFWKAVVDESERWRWLYSPLAALDRVLLTICPPLGWLCWNVVIIARHPTTPAPSQFNKSNILQSASRSE